MAFSDFWQNWIDAHRILEKDAKWLGENGWTIPMWKDPRVLADLRSVQGDLDKAFVGAYTANENKRLNELWTRLRISEGLAPWNELISQTIDCYLDSRYAVVVPSLLIVLEGAVASAADDLQSWPRTIKSIKTKRETTEASMRRLIWISIESFIEPIFGSAPFKESRPVILNRHWVSHGRETNPWALRSESIRLFHALDTVSTTVDHKR